MQSFEPCCYMCTWMYMQNAWMLRNDTYPGLFELRFSGFPASIKCYLPITYNHELNLWSVLIYCLYFMNKTKSFAWKTKFLWHVLNKCDIFSLICILLKSGCVERKKIQLLYWFSCLMRWNGDDDKSSRAYIVCLIHSFGFFLSQIWNHRHTKSPFRLSHCNFGLLA